MSKSWKERTKGCISSKHTGHQSGKTGNKYINEKKRIIQVLKQCNYELYENAVDQDTKIKRKDGLK